MSELTTETRLAAIEEKLDFIAAQLSSIAQQRDEMAQLKDDLNRVGKDLFQAAVVELEDVAPFVQTGDFLHLAKKVVRHTRHISGLINQLESLLDFVTDGRPVARELFNDTLLKLDELDQKGYFDFLRELLKAMDRFISQYQVEDLRRLGDNLSPLLETAQQLTRPEVLGRVNNALNSLASSTEQGVEEYSTWQLIKELNTPEMKRGLGIIIAIVKSLSNDPQNDKGGQNA
ncbi:MAG: DUF1641 domain-containing protein [Candidatus Delongbacteria bacterium]|nr:DUF1641 domain-containing protein [bacterium]MBL7033642.1 DUF1641 domain-containing protein [Candidatus Delongbacteria bacterium]